MCMYFIILICAWFCRRKTPERPWTSSNCSVKLGKGWQRGKIFAEERNWSNCIGMVIFYISHAYISYKVNLKIQPKDHNGHLWFPVSKTDNHISHEPSNRLPLLSTRFAITFQFHSVTAVGQYQFIILGELRHMCEGNLGVTVNDYINGALVLSALSVVVHFVDICVWISA